MSSSASPDGAPSPRRSNTGVRAGSPALATAPSAPRAGPLAHAPSTPPPPAPATSSPAPGRSLSPTSLPPNPPPGSVKAALSFVQRITVARKPPPGLATGQQQPAADGADGVASPGGSGVMSPGADGGGAAANQPPTAVVTETETIEAATPGSVVAGVSPYDDTLDVLVSPPVLERSTVAEYVATAESWLMTDGQVDQHEEVVARGLLMIRNVVRSEPRYAALASGQWLPVVRDSLGSKHGLVRSSAASALAAFAASTPGREAIRKDTPVLQRLMQMLTAGLLSGGGDNNDTQYSCLALSNIALNACSRQQLTRHGALQRAADVLRAAIRHFSNAAEAAAAAQQNHQQKISTAGGAGGPRGSKNAAAGGGSGGGAGGDGDGGGGGRSPASSLLKSATYMATMMTSWAVQPAGREQLQRYDVPRLASELHGLCCASMGDDHPLSRRLALLADTSSAAQLLQEIAEAEDGTAMGQSNWEKGQEERDRGGASQAYASNPHANVLRGVSFAGGASRGMTRASAAVNSLHRVLDTSESGESPGSGTGPGPVGAAAALGPGGGVGGGIVRSLSRRTFGTVSSSGLPPSGSLPMTSSSALGAAAAVATSAPTSPSVIFQLPSSPPLAASTTPSTTTTTTTTTTTATSTATAITASSNLATTSAGYSTALLSPRDGSTGSVTPRMGKLRSGRASQPGMTLHISLNLSSLTASPPQPGGLAAAAPSSSVPPLTPFGQRQAAFSETGFHRPGSGLLAPGTPTQQHREHHHHHQHSQQQYSLSQSMSQQSQQPPQGESSPPSAGGGGGGGRSSAGLGVHFSASIFQEAAAAAAAAARAGAHGGGGGNDDEGGAGLPRRSASSFLAQLHSHSSRGVRLPSVVGGAGGGGGGNGGGSGGISRAAALDAATVMAASRSATSSPMSARGAGGGGYGEQRPTGRLDLPFHLVRPIPSISAASSGKISRISAAYGNVTSSTRPSGSDHPLHAHQRGYTSEL